MEASKGHRFLIDGFPRNLVQARALAAMLKAIGKPLDAVVLIEVPYTEIVKRIAGRRSCPKCGAVYNIHEAAPGETLVCRNGADHPPLIQRPDDNEATVGKRLDVYEKSTRPLVDHYAKQGLLRRIDGDAPTDVVTQRLVGALLQPAPARAKAKPQKARAKPKATKKTVTATRAKPKKKAQPKVSAKSATRQKKQAPKKKAPKKKAKAQPKRKAASKGRSRSRR